MRRSSWNKDRRMIFGSGIWALHIFYTRGYLDRLMSIKAPNTGKSYNTYTPELETSLSAASPEEMQGAHKPTMICKDA
jgi:hypothetical protein